MNKKGIYLASHNAKLKYDNIVYQDLIVSRDLGGCMLSVDLEDYDFIIATPPCNYWSRANYRRNISSYSLETKNLLPDILTKLINLGKPFIVENVRNYPLFEDYDLFNKGCFVYFVGRHTYWTNVPFNPNNIIQKKDNIANLSTNQRQGGENVNNVINYWINCLT